MSSLSIARCSANSAETRNVGWEESLWLVRLSEMTRASCNACLSGHVATRVLLLGPLPRPSLPLPYPAAAAAWQDSLLNKLRGVEAHTPATTGVNLLTSTIKLDDEAEPQLRFCFRCGCLGVCCPEYR